MVKSNFKPQRLLVGVLVLWVVSAYAIEQNNTTLALPATVVDQAQPATASEPVHGSEDVQATAQAFNNYSQGLPQDATPVQSGQKADDGLVLDNGDYSDNSDNSDNSDIGDAKLGNQDTSGLTPAKGKWPKFAAYTQTGKASWYGRPFHGRLTANGERYNMHHMTAAHRYLPLNTLVKVTNLANGKSLVVRINDRGPYAGARILDLSYGAAKTLGFVSNGTAKVQIQTVHPDAI